MAELKPVYLVSGEDHAKIDAWRARVRRRAEQEGGPGALEAFDAATHDPGEVAAQLWSLTFASGPRFVLADGVERWKAAALGPLERALASPPPGTVLVLIARGAAPEALAQAVRRAGGELRDYSAPKPRELPRWVAARAQEEGLQLDAEAARALVRVVGPSQQRLSREVEKLAVAAHPAVRLGAEDVTRLASGEAPVQAYDLADAVVAGEVGVALALAEELGRRDERPARLLYPLVRRLREVHRAACLVAAGMPESRVAGALRMPPWAAKRTLAQARRTDPEALERALCLFAELELDLRGAGELDEDTAFTRALAAAAEAGDRSAATPPR